MLISAHEMNPLLPVMDRIVYLAAGRAVSGTTGGGRALRRAQRSSTAITSTSCASTAACSSSREPPMTSRRRSSTRGPPPASRSSETVDQLATRDRRAGILLQRARTGRRCDRRGRRAGRPAASGCSRSSAGSRSPGRRSATSAPPAARARILVGIGPLWGFWASAVAAAGVMELIGDPTRARPRPGDRDRARRRFRARRAVPVPRHHPPQHHRRDGHDPVRLDLRALPLDDPARRRLRRDRARRSWSCSTVRCCSARSAPSSPPHAGSRCGSSAASTCSRWPSPSRSRRLTIGAILSTALLVGPAATALRLSAKPGRAILTAAVIGLASMWLGILLAYDSYYWPPHRARLAGQLLRRHPDPDRLSPRRAAARASGRPQATGHGARRRRAHGRARHRRREAHVLRLHGQHLDRRHDRCRGRRRGRVLHRSARIRVRRPRDSERIVRRRRRSQPDRTSARSSDSASSHSPERWGSACSAAADATTSRPR